MALFNIPLFDFGFQDHGPVVDPGADDNSGIFDDAFMDMFDMGGDAQGLYAALGKFLDKLNHI